MAVAPLRLPREDLDAVLGGVGADWQALRGQHLLITGGTGFIGKWLLATLLHASRELSLGVQATVLTRDAAAFSARHPELALAPEVSLLQGDVQRFDWPAGRPLSHVVHAATDVVAQRPPSQIFADCVQGTQRVIQQMQAAGARRMLLLSSGAVYGRAEVDRIPEDHPGAPDCLAPASAYGEGKRASELLCAFAAQEQGLEIPVARCFAFVGPYLPLDKHFAIGNFIGAALAGRPIDIQGDGTSLRSYLHAADLAHWLWVLLLRGQSGRAVNVGGDEAVSIEQLARRVVAALGSDVPVRVAKTPPPGAKPQRYLPALQRAAGELGLTPRIALDDAVRRTAAWARHGQL